MTDPIEINRWNWDERAIIHARDTTGGYMLDRFRFGEDALHSIEAAELGDISQKRFFTCSATSGATHYAWFGAVRLPPVSIFPLRQSAQRDALSTRPGSRPTSW
jgi:hypothetical protein